MRKQRPIHYALFRFNRWTRRTLDNDFAFVCGFVIILNFVMFYERNRW